MKHSPQIEELLRRIFDALLPILDEKQRRMLLGVVALGLGSGGVALVKRLTGCARNTIDKGMRPEEWGIDGGQDAGSAGRIRRPGGGRKSLAWHEPELYEQMERIIAGDESGRPGEPLAWTCLSLRRISDELAGRGIDAGYNVVSRALDKMGYTKRMNRRCPVGKPGVDGSEAQFARIGATALEFLSRGEPVISLDARRRRIAIDPGTGEPQASQEKKDAPGSAGAALALAELRRTAALGLDRDATEENTGSIDLGAGRNAPETAAEAVRQWWNTVGRERFPDAHRIYVVCDGDACSDPHLRTWKQGLQRFADESGLDVHVSHLPPGTWRWNRIDHRLFCFAPEGRRPRPPLHLKAIVSLIGLPTATPPAKTQPAPAAPSSAPAPAGQCNYLVAKKRKA